MPEYVTPEQVEAARELGELRLEKWQRAAVRAHPLAQPFMDMLVGNSEQEILDLAADLAGRRRKQLQEPVEGGPLREEQEVSESSPTTPIVYVPAGAPEVLDPTAMTDEQELEQLRQDLRRNPGKSWKSYLDKKFEMALDS